MYTVVINNNNSNNNNNNIGTEMGFVVALLINKYCVFVSRYAILIIHTGIIITDFQIKKGTTNNWLEACSSE